VLPITEIDQRKTHRLIPAQYADEGASVLGRLVEDEDLLEGIYELDNATNDRLLAETDLLPGVDARELVFGIPSYRIINAAFCHAAPGGARFSSDTRNAWYASFEIETSQAEVSYHRRKWLAEIAWQEEEVNDYADYLADFHAEFHDLRATRQHRDCLEPNSYVASQSMAATLLASGSAGIVYPSVRRAKGTCLACFRPVLVTNVRPGSSYRFVFHGQSAPKISRR
jgi:hypothetical protein